MIPQSLQHILGADADLHALTERLRSLIPLQRVWQEVAPPSLASQAVVTALEAGTVTMRANGGAVASMLRQMAPSLALAMAKACPGVTTVKIQVATPESIAPRRYRQAQPLSPQSVAHFQELADQLAPSPLKTAVEQLLKHKR